MKRKNKQYATIEVMKKAECKMERIESWIILIRCNQRCLE